MTTYATLDELRDRISDTYAAREEITDDGKATALLERASELMDHVTLGRAQVAYDSEETAGEQPYRETLSRATCDQVEFWMEAGPEHDIAGLTGSVVSGRLQIHPIAARLSVRAKQTLQNGGLFWTGVAVG